MREEAKIYIGGHNGMVRSDLVRLLQQKGFQHIITRSSKELDLRDQYTVNGFLQSERPD